MSPTPRNHPEAYFWFQHNGWNVFSYSDDYGQGKVKELFVAKHNDTAEEREIDISPWFPVDIKLIRRVIDLGFPKRISLTPHTHEDLDRIEALSQAAE